MGEEVGVKDLCKSCRFVSPGCWVALVLEGVTEGACGEEETEIWVVKCDDYVPVKEEED